MNSKLYTVYIIRSRKIRYSLGMGETHSVQKRLRNYSHKNFSAIQSPHSKKIFNDFRWKILGGRTKWISLSSAVFNRCTYLVKECKNKTKQEIDQLLGSEPRLLKRVKEVKRKPRIEYIPPTRASQIIEADQKEKERVEKALSHPLVIHGEITTVENEEDILHRK